ncbi:MAG: UDP-N-acetylmuramate dehydrogenase [Acidobacteriota bacterium]|nr:UDP-N-acetylmuramate dehydrogenase [Acidobacteriota bacterium]
MSLSPAASKSLAAIPNSLVLQNAFLSDYTRFAIGGPAGLFFDTANEQAFITALQIVAETGAPHIVIGGGTNLVVSDAGFDGVVLRYVGALIDRENLVLTIGSGAVLQDVVDHSIDSGLKGLETMTGIPGYLGGAVYGNAGAYGHSIQEIIERVRIFDRFRVVEMSNEECQFRYRESIFKRHKDWIILSAALKFSRHEAGELSKTAAEIRSIRDAKYPPTMKCAGSIFKNLLMMDLPASVASAIPPKLIREGKVPSAWFLEQAGVKGIRRGDIQVAGYHANLVYNDGAGTAADLVAVIQELKDRVQDRFGFKLEEEVQYVGFNGSAPA